MVVLLNQRRSYIKVQVYSRRLHRRKKEKVKSWSLNVTTLVSDSEIEDGITVDDEQDRDQGSHKEEDHENGWRENRRIIWRWSRSLWQLALIHYLSDNPIRAQTRQHTESKQLDAISSPPQDVSSCLLESWNRVSKVFILTCSERANARTARCYSTQDGELKFKSPFR